MEKKVSASSQRDLRAEKTASAISGTANNNRPPIIGRVDKARLRKEPTAADLEDVPQLSDEELAAMIPISEWRKQQANKRLITLRVDSDVLAWFRATGDGYQSRINEALRRAMQRESK